jgi:hypothetical protein
MPTRTTFLTEGDDANELAGSGNVISFIRPELGDALSIGDLASIIVSDVAVRLSGDFKLPKLVVRTGLGHPSKSQT